MEIKIKNFILRPTTSAKDRFDLSRIVERISKEDGSKYESETEHGYSMTLDRCITIIITCHLADIDQVVELRTYINKYREIKEEVLRELPF